MILQFILTTTSTFCPFLILINFFYQKPLALLECLAISIPIGIAISSWLALLIAPIISIYISDELTLILSLVFFLLTVIEYYYFFILKKIKKKDGKGKENEKDKEKDKEKENEKENENEKETAKVNENQNEKDKTNESKTEKETENKKKKEKKNKVKQNRKEKEKENKVRKKISHQPNLFKLLMLELQNQRPLLIFFMVFFPFYLVLIHYHYLPFNKDQQEYLTMKNCFGDLPFHLNIISSFKEGCNKHWTSLTELKSIISTGSTISYPFLIDFHSSLLLSSNEATAESFRVVLILESLLLTASFYILFYFFLSRFLKSKVLSVFSLVLMSLMGGMGWYHFLKSYPENDFIHYDYIYHIDKHLDYYWFQFLDGTLIPQRSALFGYCFVVFILNSFYLLIKSFGRDHAAHTKKKKNDETNIDKTNNNKNKNNNNKTPNSSTKTDLNTSENANQKTNTTNKKGDENKIIFQSKLNAKKKIIKKFNCINVVNQIPSNLKFQSKKMLLNGILTGLLPVAHSHSFLSIAILTISFAVFNFPLRKGKRTKKKILNYIILWAIYGISANVLAIPQLFLFKERSSNRSFFFKIQPIWEKIDHSVPWFLVNGFGTTLILGSIGIFFIKLKKLIHFVTPFLLLFIFGILVKVQPWEYDNIKILNIAFFVITPIVINLLYKMLTFVNKSNHNIVIKKIGRMFILFLFVSCIASSCLSLYGIFFMTNGLFSQEYIQTGEFIKQSSNEDQIFLSSNYYLHNNPATMFAGRQLWLGHVSWVNSHGIDLSTKYEYLLMLMREYILPYHFKKILNNFDENNVTFVLNSFDKSIPTKHLTRMGFASIYQSDNFQIFERVISIENKRRYNGNKNDLTVGW
ncbi:neurofilament triplet m protein-like protein [Anaeramoeba flamelloides]|uniref:Neurofilament triplet m protein-like protein n=1 Tax=Anaeramoeba flamelloides TaxID=1746091 RepID=A0AAV7YT21_9EUKA|nr:neurofilament triplet m protein-like protein [Anaeramoeba flamelloides]